MSPCDSAPCVNGGKCLKDGDSFNCKCPSGYKGERCENKGMQTVYKLWYAKGLSYIIMYMAVMYYLYNKNDRENVQMHHVFAIK